MSVVIRDDLTVAIPEELAQELGLHGGSSVEWERTDDGGLKLRHALPRREAVNKLSGILTPYLKEQGGGVEAFLKWRDEDARLDGSL